MGVATSLSGQWPGRAHTRGCMRYCSPTPTWRADTRQASGKPQRNQVPDQLCDIRRSPARSSCFPAAPCHPSRRRLQQYTTVLERKKKDSKILRACKDFSYGEQAIRHHHHQQSTTTITSIGTSSPSERPARPGSEECQQKRLHPIIVSSRHLPHAPHRPSQAERARRPGLDQGLKRPLSHRRVCSSS